MKKEQQIIENQIALFNLTCSLYHEVTGKVPIVRIWTEDGAILTEPSLDDIICQGVVSQCPSGHLKETDKVF